ncbi:MAG: hypothetical protein JNM17_25695 [Archangium sp.]|nr:hypothetical protein [Archangium sp.]
MSQLELRGLANLDPEKLVGVTDLKVWSCAPACLEQIPDTVETLSLWYGELPNPLRLDHLHRLKSLSLNPPSHPRGGKIAIASLPAGLEKLDLWASVVERLPNPLPDLHALRFDCCDTRAVDWARLPNTLRELVATRCLLPDTVPLPALPHLTYTSWHACNLRSARALFETKTLQVVGASLTPLDDETLAALQALAKRGVLDAKETKPAKFELTRRFYAIGVNLSAETQGKKKIRIHHPLMSVVEEFPTGDVMALAERVVAGETSFVGKAFIDELHRQRYAAMAAAKAAKKAAREAAKKK